MIVCNPYHCEIRAHNNNNNNNNNKMFIFQVISNTKKRHQNNTDTSCGSLSSYHYNSLLMESYSVLFVMFIQHGSEKTEGTFLKPRVLCIYFSIFCLVLSGIHCITV